MRTARVFSTVLRYDFAVIVHSLISIMILLVSSVSCTSPPMPSSSNPKITLTDSMYNSVPLQGTTLQLYESGGSFVATNRISCALVCGERRFESPRCDAFRHDESSNSCEFYNDDDTTIMGPSSTQVFLLELYDRFHRVSTADRTFYLMLVSVRMDYPTASSHCRNLGGYIVQLDHEDKYEVLRKLFADFVTYGFVGATDEAVEGKWVSDKDGSEISVAWDSTWHWRYNQPSNGANQDCPQFAFSDMELNDVPCTEVCPIFCEKDQ